MRNRRKSYKDKVNLRKKDHSGLRGTYQNQRLEKQPESPAAKFLKLWSRKTFCSVPDKKLSEENEELHLRETQTESKNCPHFLLGFYSKRGEGGKGEEGEEEEEEEEKADLFWIV